MNQLEFVDDHFYGLFLFFLAEKWKQYSLHFQMRQPQEGKIPFTLHVQLTITQA